jgi:hypothetical protein
MGLFNDAKERGAATQEAAAAAVGSCPDPGNHYDTEVNRGSINMLALKGMLTQRYRNGYRLAHIYEQDKNTVMVFEHHFH